MVLRLATSDDIPALDALERRCFTSDRIERRQWRHLIREAHGEVWLIAERGQLLASAVLLFKSGASLARLYSLAVAPEARGRGLARRLLAKLEARCLAEGVAALRLEVANSNQAAIDLYQKAGFRPLKALVAYYQDGGDGLRMEKRLKGRLPKGHLKVPFYPQQTEFSCGPACLLMALSALKKRHKPTLSDELAIWREATTIFMTSGHGGCSGEGLALAAHRRGLAVSLCVSDHEVPFIDGVRSAAKKEVLALVYQDFLAALHKAHIPVIAQRLEPEGLARHLAGGGLALVLISSYQFSRLKAPHWVLVVAMDERFVYLHDPDQDPGQALNEVAGVPVPKAAFATMARFGRRQYGAAVLVF
ncbi:GNAT family N-acetyltransferase/peptidase C39 family protein [Gallaecimonas sp. GXIMD4217]|uniref:GNAT family N-acetyltransferase/peptidase C39 family protein n=1 Tax=Gallaecimonas sp. GXIMD4217 TaxID=3131927 RepID=UPI00311B25B3